MWWRCTQYSQHEMENVQNEHCVREHSHPLVLIAVQKEKTNIFEHIRKMHAEWKIFFCKFVFLLRWKHSVQTRQFWWHRYSQYGASQQIKMNDSKQFQIQNKISKVSKVACCRHNHVFKLILHKLKFCAQFLSINVQVYMKFRGRIAHMGQIRKAPVIETISFPVM